MAGARGSGAPLHARGVLAGLLVTVTVVVGVFAGGLSAAGAGGGGVVPVAQKADSVSTGVVAAADLSRFQPGNIIGDAVFFNSNTMTEAQIQAFLEAKVPSCQSGYICLKDWYDTSRTTTADAMCGNYSGGVRERASRIIYKVARACGINPQVILATLQKEQGLVTHVWPSDWRYTIAMGQGCPDTAACDTRYYGFFNQVYGAAWQLKRYANPPGTSKYFTWYAPGKTWNVRFHPDAACGSSPVYIQNQATANLYYYTPYQPNAAALAAGYSAANNPCSSYGNRNFFNYFTDWFGSTQRDVAGEIEWEYQAQGGAGGLGAPLTEVVSLSNNGGGFGRAYGRGSIYWSYEYGAKTVREGAIRDYYFSRSGADGDVGWPVLNYQLISGNGISGQGQLFSGGSIYSSSLGTYIVRELVRSGYFSLSGATGQLGWPLADQTCTAGICSQAFQGGSVVSSSRGAYPVVDPVRQPFEAAGGATGSWGVPITGPTWLPHAGGGTGQAFANGSVYYRADNRAFYVTGPIRDEYFAQNGAAGRLGFPVSDQQCSGSTACQQQFQSGWILWTASAGARIGDPAIDTTYAAAGGAAGSLGARTGTFLHYGFNGGGFAEGFANGAIFYKPGVGAFELSGAIRDAYFAAGGAAGAYGWPTSAAACASGICRQDFEGGSYASSSLGGYWIVDPIRAKMTASGGMAAWGAPSTPLTTLTTNGGGHGQAFASGSAYYRADGKVSFVSGAIRERYFASNGASGSLGFPVSDMSCDGSSACRQQFQYGWIMWTAAAGARIGDPAIDAAYAAAGGANGALGATVGGLVYYPYSGGGFAQGFANGAIFYKPSVGTAYPVTGGVRTAYFDKGGAAGVYGWPTGAMTCAAGTCSQAFEGGVVTAPAA